MSEGSQGDGQQTRRHGGFVRAVKHLIQGPPIATHRQRHERLSVPFALPTFASDALSSVAYSTEAVLLVLVMTGTQNLHYVVPIGIAITILLAIVAASYHQTIHAYPSGGGSYIVASDNLGSKWGRVAGASLLTDYVLTVAVSETAGVAAVVSALPSLQPYQAHLAALLVAIVALVNLRGVRESGFAFALPTYSFVVGVLGLVAVGAYQWMTGTFHPAPPPSLATAATPLVPLSAFIMLRAFAGGCTAMTGVEAVSNGIPAFKPPESDNAAKTLRILAYLLGSMVIGTAILAHSLRIVPIPEDAKGYQTVLSMIAQQLVGRSWFYYFVQFATTAILMLAANTSFADFPRMCSFLARDGYLPRQLATLGDRLVFHWGILLLAGISIGLIYAFGGYTNRLLPLYAIGVFVSFTLSQFGMVVRWTRLGGSHWRRLLNLVGGILTTIVGLTFAVTKFAEGAWMVPVVGAVLLVIFAGIKRHYDYYGKRMRPTTYAVPSIKVGTVLVLVPRVHVGVFPAVQYAKALATDCRAVHVALEPGKVANVKAEWERSGLGVPLVVLEAPYRSLIDPIMEYLDQTLAENPGKWVTVVVPEAVPSHWWQVFLHKNVSGSIKRALGTRKNVVVTNVRYHL